MTNQNGNSRSTFSGGMGYVLAVAGSAVGLGNIWRFPYLAAEYGGGIFLLTYLLLAVTFGYTMIVSETALGTRDEKEPGRSFPPFREERLLYRRRLDQCCHPDADPAVL